jgi:hypothetical protein
MKKLLRVLEVIAILPIAIIIVLFAVIGEFAWPLAGWVVVALIVSLLFHGAFVPS